MTYTFRKVVEKEFSFTVQFTGGLDIRIAKPCANAADGWMERGMAKTADEAKTLALAMFKKG